MASATRPFLMIIACAMVCLWQSPALLAQPGVIRWGEPVSGGGTVKSPLELDDGVLLGAYTNPVGGGIGIHCTRSTDGGRSWQRLSVIASDPESDTDIGDGNFALLSNGDILHSYRLNYYRGRRASEFRYAIEVAISKDRGESWQHHSTVMTSRGENAGLWSSFILETKSGSVQCYYDDEVTPRDAGFERHQWITMKTWDANRSAWVNPVTVSRAKNPGHLSRDGVPSVVELPGGRLVCAVESVSTNAPITALIRLVVSNDGGRSWSWSKTERPIVFGPRNTRYNAGSPWMTVLSDGSLICVFETDEDMPEPNDTSTGIRNEDLKCVVSTDGGQSWSAPAELLDDNAPLYLPGVIQLKHGPEAGTILITYVNTKTGVLYTKRGQLAAEREAVESPAAEDGALAFAEIEMRGACGDGLEVYLVNTGTRTLAARVSKHWTVGDEQKSHTTTVVVRADDEKRLGCSVRRVAARTSREFRWVVESASFR